MGSIDKNKWYNRNILIFLFALFSALRIVGYMIDVSLFYYALLFVSLGKYVSISKPNYAILFFDIFVIFGLLLLENNEILNREVRFLLFLLTQLCIGPLFYSNKLYMFRLNLLNYTLIILSIFSICSVFCYFLGVNYMSIRAPDASIDQAGIFSGITTHSMILGPISGVSSCFILVNFLHKLDQISLLKKIVYIIALGFVLISLLLAASRTAFLSAFVALFYIVISHYGLKRLIVRKLGYIFIILVFLSPILYSFMGGLIAKQDANKEVGGAFSSRDTKFNARLTEFNSSPLFGIGFATINTSLDKVSEDGAIEPGTSWGALLSMTGIIGFALVFFNYVRVIYNLHFSKFKSKTSLLLSSLCIFFFLHLVTEGYILAAGSYLFFLFWLVYGTSYSYIKLYRK